MHVAKTDTEKVALEFYVPKGKNTFSLPLGMLFGGTEDALTTIVSW